MVKVCSLTNYPDENFSKFKEYFERFNYPLHTFQKWAIEGIVEGKHILVTAPTGSGKSLPAEFAIDFFHSKGKKTIYCSPIKALSNQKFYDFSQKYPGISIGLITGDIKTNPDADILIMTTEILLNKLYQIKSTSKPITSSVSFDMDIENELACVVFDEIHMINDESRGHVWENSIMLLPKHIQMIGLSATLDDPEKFANWLENKGEQNNISKEVYLTKKLVRAVPLTHYSFITTNQGIFKAIKDKTVHAEINAIINKPFVIQSSKGQFDEIHYNKMNKLLKLFETNNIRVKRGHVLNQVSKYLCENEMLPALCYVFSRKQLEICAKEVTTNLLEFDSKIPYIIRRECEQIIRKLPNYEEYLHLPEYLSLVSLLEKGISTHHSGMMPVLREIVEILFSKGYIKLLFCTESVAIGLNLPVKTTIFTDINKHDGKTFRMLQGHEFVQASGRAGRLGLDTVGNVIHLNNLFRNVNITEYKVMMAGKPQTLTSKFKISYNLLLNLIDIGDSNLIDFAKKSMVTGDLDVEMNKIYTNIKVVNVELLNMNSCLPYLRTPIYVIEEYIDLQNIKNTVVNKKRKEVERRIDEIKDEYKFIESDKIYIQKMNDFKKEATKLHKQHDLLNNYINTGVKSVLELLLSEKYIEHMKQEEEKEKESLNFKLTLKGSIASQLREVHCLIFAKLFEDENLNELSSKQIVSILSCFTNISVSDEFKDNQPKCNDLICKNTILKISDLYTEYQEKETQYNIQSGLDYNIHFDLMDYVTEWCNCENKDQCKLLLQKLGNEKEIFLGEFVKALLKINNISNEMEKIAEMTGNIFFLNKLREIPNITLKYVVTNQSLYV
jgi:superfamily II RNA helicase